MTNAVYASLVNLCVDICRRNGKTKLLWLGDKAKTLVYSPKSDEMVLTVHRWFANKACPGDWLYARLGKLASEVTKKLGGSTSAATETKASTTKKPSSTKTTTGFPYTVRITADELNIRKGPGTSNAIIGSITDKGVYTITEESDGAGASKWGHLKSGAGWISLDYATKL